MFGNSGSAPSHNSTLLPTTSVSSVSASSLFNLPSFVSPSADSSAVLPPSSVIVPPQPHHFQPQIGASPSLFGANPLMGNLIASLASLSRRPHPIISHDQTSSTSSHQNGFPFIAEVFQNSLADCLRHSSSTPNGKNELSFLGGAMDNNNNGSTTTTLPNANLLNASLPSDRLPFAEYSSVAQKSVSSVELLEQALEAFAVANQSKMGISSAPPTPSVISSPLVTTPFQHSQSEQFTNGTTTATALSSVEQQLLSLLTFSRLNSSDGGNQSSKNGVPLSPFAPPNLHLLCSNSNGICHPSSTMTATTTSAPTTVAEPTQHNGSVGEAADKQTARPLPADSTVADQSMPIDLSSPNPQQSLLFSSTVNLAQSSVPRGRKSCDIRRSASSVSYKGNADVHEHFQRTFSGKWPRRQPSLRSHLQMGGGRTAVGKKEAAALCIGENEAEGSGTARTAEPMEEEEERDEGGPKSGTEGAPVDHKSPEGMERAALCAQKGRPKSRQQTKSVYSAVIRKLFTSNEVKQVEDHFRKSLGEDRFLQIKNEQQRKQWEEQPIGNGREDKSSEKEEREERERDEKERDEERQRDGADSRSSRTTNIVRL